MRARMLVVCLICACGSSSTPPPGGGVVVPPSRGSGPAVVRGESWFGFPERFNRYYTEPGWTPAREVFVSPSGSGDGTSASSPSSVAAAFADAEPGTKITFLAGTYAGCYELDGVSGTYDAPIVLYGQRNQDGSLAVRIDCCASGRQTCINLEAASYVAVDGFELAGGRYGVRAVGSGFDASDHQRGLAVLSSVGHDQSNDPFFTGAVDWAVFEGNLGRNAGSGDGHGIYLSNGSDWNIVRYNELHSNVSSDFQINADPAFTCVDEGVSVDDPLCHAYAGTGEGGRGASDYMLVESNFFHHGLAQGANFTSVRRSVVRNNIFALYERHGVSFWQETDNPALGSSDNLVHHNLFVAKNSNQMLQFIVSSTRNDVRNNLFVGVTLGGASVTANPNAVWMEVDSTVSANVYADNFYISGSFDGRDADASETTRADFDPAWFARFPALVTGAVAADFKPAVSAPWLDQGALLSDTPRDRDGTLRVDPSDPGPYERP